LIFSSIMFSTTLKEANALLSLPGQRPVWAAE
jgi:hypothetical protein